MAATLPLLSGCASLATIFPDGEARAQIRADKRRDDLLDRQRRMRAAQQSQPDEAERTLDELVHDGDLQRAGGNLGAAYTAYLRAHYRDRQHPVPLERIAYLTLRGDAARAGQLFSELLELHPQRASLHAGLGLAHLADDDLQGARDALLDALELEPRLMVAHASLGVVFDRLGRHAEARQHYEVARELRPSDPEVFNNLGVSHLLSGDYQAAAEALRGALVRGSQDPAVRNNLGIALGLAGRHDEAFEVFLEAGSRGDAYNNLGYVYFLQGSYEQALEAYGLALLSDDTDEERVIRNLTMVEEARRRSP
jgi:Flp pilus assembly protein TadD